MIHGHFQTYNAAAELENGGTGVGNCTIHGSKSEFAEYPPARKTNLSFSKNVEKT